MDKWTESELRAKIDEYVKEGTMTERQEVKGKMVSKMYSYDFADNERYLDLKKIVKNAGGIPPARGVKRAGTK